MVLEVKNLDVTGSSNSNDFICKNLNFSVNQGETLGILGESGSGKSITALSILQLLPAGLHNSSGEIIFTKSNGDVVNLLQLSNKDLQKIRGKEISMIFQEPMSSLNPVYTCGSQVEEIIIQHLKLSKTQAKVYTIELFNKVKLIDPARIYSSYPYQLSGGQKQRVMIAMAISCKPQLLIADEPTTALDVSVQKSILLLLKELQTEMGMSILFITHDIQVLAEISHQAAVFYKGEIVEKGDIKQILHNAEHPYTKGLMSCRYSINDKGERLKTVGDFLNSNDQSSNNISIPNKLIHPNHPVFEVSNLTVNYRKPKKSFLGKLEYNTVLNNIDFTVFNNETLGIVGESGSGKTTIGRTLLKLIDSFSGNIKFHGTPISRFSPTQMKAFRQRVQIIFQDPYSSLNPKISVGEAIEEPLIVHKIFKTSKARKERVYELLKQVNLSEEHYHRYPHQFSGGQRQRIGIARALAVNPEIIVLDESVAALDVSVQAQVLNLLNDLKAAYNLTYIFISHDLNVVRYMSDRILVLNQGNIVEQGLSEVIFNTPEHPYTKNLLESIPGRNY